MHRLLLLGTSLSLLVTVVAGRALSQSFNNGFADLPACDQLSAVQRDGKSVAEYIAGSGFDDFAMPVAEGCPEYLDALTEAWEIVVAAPQTADFAFARLSTCEKLFVIEDSGQTVTDFIVDSGWESFSQPIVEDCPRHLQSLSEAWSIAVGTGEGTDNPVPFPELPACTQLNIIEQDGKSVPQYIAGSGIEKYRSDIRTQCRQFIDELNTAENILNGTTSRGLNPTFESLAPCQKLQVIEGEGKSVPQYIAASGVEDFAADVYGMCRSYIPDLIEAEAILEGGN